MEQNYEIYLKRSLQAVGESPLRSLTRLQQGQRARRYHHHHHHHHPCHPHPHLHHHLHCDQIKRWASHLTNLPFQVSSSLGAAARSGIAVGVLLLLGLLLILALLAYRFKS